MLLSIYKRYHIYTPSCCSGVAIRYNVQRIHGGDGNLAVAMARMYKSAFNARVQRTAGEALGLEDASDPGNLPALLAAFGLFDENNDGGGSQRSGCSNAALRWHPSSLQVISTSWN